MRKRKRQLDQRQQICLGLNLLIIFAELLGLYLRFYILGSPGLEYYTVLSNILSLVASSFMVYDLLAKGKIRHLTSVLRQLSVVMMTVTFAVVLFILPWNMNVALWKLLLPGQMFFLHLSCPLLSISTFFFAERHRFFNRDHRYSSIPTMIYAVLILALNYAGVVVGPYPFITKIVHQNNLRDMVAAAVICYFVTTGLGSLCIWYHRSKMQKIYDKRANAKELREGNLHKA